MNAWDYILTALIAVAVAGAAAAVIIRKRRGGTCCRGCSECACSGTCPKVYSRRKTAGNAAANAAGTALNETEENGKIP